MLPLTFSVKKKLCIKHQAIPIRVENSKNRYGEISQHNFAPYVINVLFYGVFI